MYGLLISFKNYRGGSGGLLGIFNSPWIGFDNFKNLFSSIYFKRIFTNTLIISFYRVVFSFPAPIILAILINEIRNTYFKKIVQTISYMPYFLSWVVVAGLMSILLSPVNGPVNALLNTLGFDSIYFLSSTKYFRSMLVISEIWKNVGYSTIIYLAAITSIDIEQYEAAHVSGANKLQQIYYITLPGISEIIAIILILSVGRILEDNFEQIFNLYSPAVYEVADVFETYIYRTGIVGGQFSYAAAVGLFKSVVSLILVFLANSFAKKMGSRGLF